MMRLMPIFFFFILTVLFGSLSIGLAAKAGAADKTKDENTGRGEE